MCGTSVFGWGALGSCAALKGALFLQESKARAGNPQSLQRDKDVVDADVQILPSKHPLSVGHEPVEKRRLRTREERRQRELERESEQAKARRDQIWR